MKQIFITLIFTTALCTFFSCSGKKESNKNDSKKIDTSQSMVTPEAPKAKGPIINIQDSLEVEQTVLCLKDSASTAEDMYTKLSKIFNVKLQETIKTGKLKIMGSPMAWQLMQNGAYFFEAGIPVDKVPAKMGKGMFMKSTGTDSTVVAHFWGKQDQTISAYSALDEKLTEQKKTKSSDAYEIYRGNYFPVNNEPVDFYKLQVDIIVPFKKVIYKTKIIEIPSTKGTKSTKPVKAVKKKKPSTTPSK